MTIEIRAIQEQHLPDILAVAEALPEWFNADARRRAIPADLRHQPGFVALVEGQVVGFITLFFAEGRLNIGWIGVRPDHRRQGIGSCLLACAEEFGRRRGLIEIATYTLGDSVEYEPYEATRRFYRHQGFVVYQRNTTDNPDCPEEIRLKKGIAPRPPLAEDIPPEPQRHKVLLQLFHKLNQLRLSITRPITVGARLILVQDGSVLLVKHTYRPEWYLPGGGVRRRETIEQAARREAAEELGAHLGTLHLLGVYSNFYEDRSDHSAVLWCHDFALTGKTDREIERFQFFPLDDLPPGASPGTRRRIREYTSAKDLPVIGLW